MWCEDQNNLAWYTPGSKMETKMAPGAHSLHMSEHLNFHKILHLWRHYKFIKTKKIGWVHTITSPCFVESKQKRHQTIRIQATTNPNTRGLHMTTIILCWRCKQRAKHPSNSSAQGYRPRALICLRRHPGLTPRVTGRSSLGWGSALQCLQK